MTSNPDFLMRVIKSVELLFFPPAPQVNDIKDGLYFLNTSSSEYKISFPSTSFGGKTSKEIFGLSFWVYMSFNFIVKLYHNLC